MEQGLCPGLVGSPFLWIWRKGGGRPGKGRCAQWGWTWHWMYGSHFSARALYWACWRSWFPVCRAAFTGVTRHRHMSLWRNSPSARASEDLPRSPVILAESRLVGRGEGLTAEAKQEKKRPDWRRLCGPISAWDTVSFLSPALPVEPPDSWKMIRRKVAAAVCLCGFSLCSLREDCY